MSDSSAGGVSSQITFQSPALPRPATVLRNPGGVRSSGSSLNLKMRSAAGAAKVISAAIHRKKFRIKPERNKNNLGDKSLCCGMSRLYENVPLRTQ
jgi:hypothetical protein